MPDRSSNFPLDSVRLREVEAGDIPTLFQIQLDPEGNRMAAVKPRDRETFDGIWAKIVSERTAIARAILAHDELVGSISCFKRDGLDYVGYWIAKEHWGKGIATRALALLLKEVIIRPLHARVARANTASMRVLERCGFVVTTYQMSPETDRLLACEEAQLVLK